MVHNMEENWREFWKGVLAQLPVQLGVIPFGLVFGVLGIASGLTLWVFWQISTVAGVFLGANVPPYLNLEFAIPLTFIAIILPKLKSAAQISTAVTASIIAIFGQ